MSTIVLYGLSACPPGEHHRAVVEILAAQFDRVIVIPCGPRPDKPFVGGFSPGHRAALTDLAFRGIPKVEVLLDDLEYDAFTPTYELDHAHALKGELWHAVGSDLIAGGKDGKAPIQGWYKGEEVWKKLRFAVMPRAGYPIDPADLPPNHRLMPAAAKTGSSTEIRQLLYEGRSIAGLVSPESGRYLERYRLFGNGPGAGNSVPFDLHDPRPLVVCDDSKQGAAALRQKIKSYPAHEANCILVLGGDGTMLKAVREHWRLRLPCYGVNFGRYGYLLNDVADAFDPERFLKGATVERLPLLRVDIKTPNDRWLTCFAFNDAWVERATSQMALLEVSVNSEVKIQTLFADSALVATPAGSTGYARNMGATPLPVQCPGLVLVGGNVAVPRNWHCSNLRLEDKVEIRPFETEKRPIRALVDGVDCGLAERMHVRVSRTAAVELVNAGQGGFVSKLTRAGFP